MTVDASQIVVDSGELTLGGVGLGFTSDAQPGMFLTITHARNKLNVGERGISPVGIIEQGYDALMIVHLVQWDANALGKVFPGITTGTTVTIDATTVPAGTRLDTTAGQFFTLSWAGALKTITAGLVVPSISSDQIQFSTDAESILTIEIDFVLDSSNELLTIADT